jgi:hypothetical protein
MIIQTLLILIFVRANFMPILITVNIIELMTNYYFFISNNSENYSLIY